MLLRFVVLFSLLLRVSLGSNDENGDKDVVRGVPLELTDATFDQAIVSNEFGFPFHFVGFFSSNCPHCISLLPVWRLLAKEYKETKIEESVDVRWVEGKENRFLMEHFQVRAFPTLLFFTHDKKGELFYREYPGDRARQLESLLDFITTARHEVFQDDFSNFLSLPTSPSLFQVGLLKLEYWVTENPVVWFVICAGFGSVLGFVIVTFCLDDSFFEIEEEEGKKKVEKKQKKKPKSE